MPLGRGAHADVCNLAVDTGLASFGLPDGEGPGRRVRRDPASSDTCHSHCGVWSGSFVPRSLALLTVSCEGGWSVLQDPLAGVVAGLGHVPRRRRRGWHGLPPRRRSSGPFCPRARKLVGSASRAAWTSRSATDVRITSPRAAPNRINRRYCPRPPAAPGRRTRPDESTNLGGQQHVGQRGGQPRKGPIELAEQLILGGRPQHHPAAAMRRSSGELAEYQGAVTRRLSTTGQ
jgi:hypothetical protein